jgi:hypothetical protein
MAVKPTASQVRELLEGYDIDSAIVSDSWINNNIDDVVIPAIEIKTGLSFTSEQEVTEIYSGNGENKVILDRRPVISLEKIEYVNAVDGSFLPSVSSVEVQNAKGILISKGVREGNVSYTFPKGDSNIKITYKYGYSSTAVPASVSTAMKYICASNVLKHVAGMTGGGNQNTQAHSPNHGEKGRYSNEIKRLRRTGAYLLSKYKSSVVGS